MPTRPPAEASHLHPPSLVATLRHAVQISAFHADSAQERAARQLDACHDALHAIPPGSAVGVYLWGPVGRGKTWLLDAFFQRLRVPARRQHFHHFMQWVHRRQFQLMGTPAPLLVLARELAQEIRVLCFDELFVADIADAMLLGTLFQALFTHGVTIVATSNQPPQQLYADGFNRERFLPAIRAIEKHMTIIAVDGGQDHRLHSGQQSQRYFVKNSQNNADFLTRIKTLSGTDLLSQDSIIVGSRTIGCVAQTDKALWCTYEQLCKAPLAAPDFIALCDRFEVILLADVPALGGTQQAGRIARGTEDGVAQVHAGDRVLPALAPNDDSVRRFIALVDECYDRGIPLYIEADVALDSLYERGYLEFPFRRAISRLKEMQFERYGLKATKGGDSDD